MPESVFVLLAELSDDDALSEMDVAGLQLSKLEASGEKQLDMDVSERKLLGCEYTKGVLGLDCCCCCFALLLVIVVGC